MALHLFTTAPALPGFLQEADGSASAMRLMCVFFAAAAIVFGGVTLLVPEAAAVGVTVTGMFLAAAVTGKVAQRVIEDKRPPTTPA